MPAGLRLPPLRKGPPGLAPWRGAVALPTPAAPATPSTPSPADTATAYYTLLSWVSAGAAKFDIYLDTVNPPATIVVPKYVGTSYVPTLAASTTYYWKIVAFNDGGSATGPVWSFTTPRATAVLFSLAGSIVTARARFGSLSIHDALNAAPNTASLLFDTTAPTGGQAITIGLGTLDAANLLFGGEIQSVDQSYVDTTSATVWPVNLIDQTFAINKRRPFGTWVNVSATTIAQYCVAVFAPGFTSTAVQAGLPAVSINFDGSADFMACMTTLAQAASTASAPCYTYVDYAKGLHLFTSEVTASPTPLTITNPPLNDPSPITFSTDLSQLRTRVYGKGHGETVPCNLAVGEPIVPIADATLFTTTGGKAVAATTAGGAQTQILTYGGVQLGGGVSLVGPGVAPSVAPTMAQSVGSGLGNGVYQYAYTDVTASGESLPSPLGSITVGPTTAVTAPTVGPTVDPNGTSNANFNAGTALLYLYAYRTASGETVPSPSTATTSVTNGGGASKSINLTAPCSSDATVTLVIFYESHDAGVTYRQFDTVTNVPSTTASTTNTGPGVAVLNPVSNNVTISGIAVGPSGTTARKLYRTAVGASQLKLQQTIANNTATVGVVDATADGSLGANVPTGDTSGLTQTTGQVNAGSSSLLTAGAAAFAPDGGWASVGPSVFRYTSVSGNTLTGIPTSGVGALGATATYGAQVVAVPALTGVNHSNGIAVAIAKGASVNIWVQRDDTAAQTALGLLELDDAGLPTDGIREYTISDGRYSEAGLTALCDADLALFSRPIVSATYYTRDRNATSGKTVSIDLRVGIFDSMFDPAVFDVYTGWGLSGSFVIQDVTITFDGPGLNPLRQVKASSVSFTLSDLLRKVVLS